MNSENDKKAKRSRLKDDLRHFQESHSRWIKHRHRAGTKEDWTPNQCGGCIYYVRLTGAFFKDWGICTNASSPKDAQATFEHDSCDFFSAASEGWDYPREDSENKVEPYSEDMELKVLIQWVGLRSGINFIYDDQAVNQRITIILATKVPADSWLGLLQSALKMHGLIIVDGDQPSSKKVLPVTNVNSVAQPTTPISATAETSMPVTRLFSVRYADVAKIDESIKPFLTASCANTVPLPDRHLLIVSDFAPAMEKIARKLKVIDHPLQNTAFANVCRQVIQIKNMDVIVLQERLQQILAAKEKDVAEGTETGSPSILLVPESRSNHLHIIGPREKVAVAIALAASLDGGASGK
jgi:type II secretory pathway component GspD/PulD (secretin)